MLKFKPHGLARSSWSSAFKNADLLETVIPRVIGTLQDVDEDQGAGTFLINTAAAFSADATSYAVTGSAAATINATTGQITLDLTNELDVTLSVTASNSAGTSPAVTFQATINAINNAPVAIDDTITTAFETAVTIDVVGNDTDADGDTLTLQSVTQGANGTVAIVSNQAVFTPDTGFDGADSFTYTISDGNGGTDTGTVAITVMAAPVATNDPNQVLRFARGGSGGSNGLYLDNPGFLAGDVGADGIWFSAFIEDDGTDFGNMRIFSLADPSSGADYISVHTSRILLRQTGEAETQTADLPFIGTTAGSAATYLITARIWKDGSDVFFQLMRNGDLSAVQTYSENDFSLAGFTRLGWSMLAKSSPNYGRHDMHDLHWGTGDPTAYHNAIYNAGAFGVDPTSYDFAGTAGVALVGSETGTRYGTVNNEDVTPAELTNAWTQVGDVEWTDATISYSPSTPAVPELLYAFSFSEADTGTNYLINGRDITDGGVTSIGATYGVTAGATVADDGGVVHRGSGTETASFDVTDITDGAQVIWRASVQCNNFNDGVGAASGAVTYTLQWQDDAGTDLGDIITPVTGLGAIDQVVFDGDITTTKPVGATRLRSIATLTSGAWTSMAVVLNNIACKVIGGSGDWPEVYPVIGFAQQLRDRITYYGETITFDTPTLVTQHVGGAFHVPPGTPIPTRSTATVTDRHGIVRDVVFDTNAEAQGFDGRLQSGGDGYDAALRETLPLTLAENETVHISISNDTNGARSGTIEQHLVIYATTAVPDHTSAEPTLVRDGTVALPALALGPAIDYAARLAELPTYTVNVGGGRPAQGRGAIYGERLDPGPLMTDQTSGARSYEEWSVVRASDSDADNDANYGRNQAGRQAFNYLALLDGAYDPTYRLRLAEAIVNRGARFLKSGESGVETSSSTDGGHKQVDQAAAFLSLHFLSEKGDTLLHNWFTSNQGFGNYKGAFEVTQAFLDSCVPHTIDTAPRQFHLRNITAIESSTNMLVAGRNDLQTSYENLPVTLSDGSLAANVDVMVGVNGNNINDTDPIRLTVPDTTGFAVNDVVYFDWQAGRGAPALGSYHWTDKANTERFSDSKTTGYAQLQVWHHAWMIQMACGARTDTANDAAFWGYMDQALTDSSIQFFNRGETPYGEAFRTQNLAALQAIPQPLLV